MTIRDNVKEIRREILLECLGENKPTTRRIQAEAIQAMISGSMTSTDCRKYMENYSKSEAQIKRLMGEDGTGGDVTKQKARAYLVANGTCGTETVTKFEVGVSDVLDQ